MKTPFTSGEVQAAIKQLQNNKRAGGGNIKAELLKYGTENITKEIATIYNEIAIHSNKINQWVINSIQKPGKPKWPIENLRPIALLSALRKILATCLKKRIIQK